MRIWRCPKCNDGIRGLERPRKNDVTRFCLKCSAKEGKLIERFCPALSTEKIQKVAVQTARKMKQNDRAAFKAAEYAKSEKGLLEAFVKEALELDAFKHGTNNFNPKNVNFKVRIARGRKIKTKMFEPDPVEAASKENAWRAGIISELEYQTWHLSNWKEKVVEYPRSNFSSGHAWGNSRAVITAGSDSADAYATIIHEIAHLAAGYKDGAHGDAWRSIFAAACKELTGETVSGKTKQDLHKNIREAVKRWLDRRNGVVTLTP